MIILISRKNSSPRVDKIIDQACSLHDEHQLIYRDEKIIFDYLIIDDFTLLQKQLDLPFLLEDGLPITNFYHQTSIEHIYYLKSEQQNALYEILEHIYYGDY